MGDFDRRGRGEMDAAVMDHSTPEMKTIPLEQVEGDIWIVAVLDDLVNYADYRQIGDLAEVLRTTRSKVARTLLN